MKENVAAEKNLSAHRVRQREFKSICSSTKKTPCNNFTLFTACDLLLSLKNQPYFYASKDWRYVYASNTEIATAEESGSIYERLNTQPMDDCPTGGQTQFGELFYRDFLRVQRYQT